jgi:hypothetical protein
MTHKLSDLALVLREPTEKTLSEMWRHRHTNPVMRPFYDAAIAAQPAITVDDDEIYDAGLKYCESLIDGNQQASTFKAGALWLLERLQRKDGE